MNESLAWVIAAAGAAMLGLGLILLWLAKGMLEAVTALWGFYHEHRMYLGDYGREMGQGDVNSEVTDEHGQAG